MSGESSPSPSSPAIVVVPPTLDALSVAKLFRENKFEDVRAHLSNTLNLSADQLKNGWQSYMNLIGPISDIKAVNVNIAKVNGRVGAILVTTAYDQSGNINYLWLNPVPLDENPNRLSLGAIVGICLTVVLVLFLVVAFFRGGQLGDGQWAIMRILGALCAGFAAALFTGDALLKMSRSYGGTELTISGAAGFALFFTVWFFFPRSGTKTP